MTPRALVTAAVALALALPAVSRGQDAGDPGDAPSGGYDVSVDLNTQPTVGFDTFQQPLQAYGEWTSVAPYGTVWRPHVAAGWRPYYYGRWEWTNEGWLWVSDEPFGWATYHYGRWAYDPYAGWIWVPGYQWAPAWVTWRVSGDVVGWAPLAPGYSIYVTSYPFVDFWWTFVPCQRFVATPVYAAAYAPGSARQWYGATAPAPAYVPARGGGVARPSPAWGGPAPHAIEQRIGRSLPPARIGYAPAPGWHGGGRPGEIPIYRPDRGPHAGGPGVGAAPGDAHGGGNGRGPGPVPAPGWPGPGGSGTPPQGGNGRGPGTAPAPGGSGTRGGGPSPQGNNGRGPGWAPAPGWTPRGNGAPPQAGSGRGPATAPAPGWAGQPGRGVPSVYVPAPRNQGGGQSGGGGGHSSGGGHQGGGHAPQR
jgi:uncharacterized membrane protein YgcG